MMAPLSKACFEDYDISMALPTIELGPMDRFDYIPIALILRDTNPLHLDRVYAQERGLHDVVQQGPLNQAYLYRYFTSLLVVKLFDSLLTLKLNAYLRLKK